MLKGFREEKPVETQISPACNRFVLYNNKPVIATANNLQYSGEMLSFPTPIQLLHLWENLLYVVTVDGKIYPLNMPELNLLCIDNQCTFFAITRMKILQNTLYVIERDSVRITDLDNISFQETVHPEPIVDFTVHQEDIYSVTITGRLYQNDKVIYSFYDQPRDISSSGSYMLLSFRNGRFVIFSTTNLRIISDCIYDGHALLDKYLYYDGFLYDFAMIKKFALKNEPLSIFEEDEAVVICTTEGAIRVSKE